MFAPPPPSLRACVPCVPAPTLVAFVVSRRSPVMRPTRPLPRVHHRSPVVPRRRPPPPSSLFVDDVTLPTA